MGDELGQVILDELRAHRLESADRHEKLVLRVTSLEETRAEQRGVLKSAIFSSTIISGTISFLINIFGRH